MAFQVGEKLKEKNLKLVVAESCTGGLIGHLITNVPGSSEYYLGGVCPYSYEAKKRILGVDAETLVKYGAVSRETALEMAVGARHLLAADFDPASTIGLSVTGIAGPGGGMPHKPVGLVWIGMSTPEDEQAWHFTWDGDRVQNKEKSAQIALKLLLGYLNRGITRKLLPVEVRARQGADGVWMPIQLQLKNHSYGILDSGRRWKDEMGEHVLVLSDDEIVYELVKKDETWFMRQIPVKRKA